MKTSIHHSILILLFAILSACGESPTGRKQVTLIPEGKLKAMGIDTFEQLKQSNEIETDQRILRYVHCVTERLVRHLPDDQVNWEVRVFTDPTPNAFALPGGKIGVNTGIFTIAQTPDQLAAIIGHEIGHVLANHANERLTQQLGVKVVLFLVNLFSDEPGSWQHDLLMKGMGLGTKVGVLLPFSRIHESEADLIGLEVMAQSGFDPRQSIDLWENMVALDQRQPLAFLSTHPSHETRIEKLEATMEDPLKRYDHAVAKGYHHPPCK